MLNYLLQMTYSINEVLDTISNHENRLVNFERCSYFMEVQSEEGYKGLPQLEKVMRAGKDVKFDMTKMKWPQNGNLKIENLSVKYRQDLPYVLKNINLDIKQGTKVGIVGRTGAGKTTLISSIYRNFDEYSGKVLFSGKEISDLDLKILRNSMTIIP